MEGGGEQYSIALVSPIVLQNCYSSPSHTRHNMPKGHCSDLLSPSLSVLGTCELRIFPSA